MTLVLDKVLDAATLRRVHAALAGANFSDGGASAGWSAQGVKANEQATHAEASMLIRQSLETHPVFQSAAIPARISTPFFSRYRAGMAYGPHVDNAVMAGTPLLRSDLAATVFLSDSSDYAGGELTLHTHEGAVSYKLDAGQALLYPATSLHSVEPVRSGVRHAAILWVQSLVREASRREILFDLDQARKQLWDRDRGQASDTFSLINKGYSNLLRAWAET